MIDLNIVSRQLQATALGLTDIVMRPPREVRVTVKRATIPGLADYLRDRFSGRPELILAEDTRAELSGFTLRHIFELERADVFVVASSFVPDHDRAFPSLATRSYLASRFEREILDLFGLLPLNHPDLRRLPLHQFWPADYHPLLKDAFPPDEFTDDGTPYPFRRVEGEGIHEITVGPVHAGIIEPGHFRFSVEGETIINLESRLYFVHKGIEKLFETVTLSGGVELAERISGGSAVAHAMAFCQALEALAAVTTPARGDLPGGCPREVGTLLQPHLGGGANFNESWFAFANAHAMRLKEEVL